MPFEPSARVQDLLGQIKAYMDEVVPPLEQQMLRTEFAEMLPELSAAREAVKQRGLWNPHLPEEYEGLGLSLMEFVHVSELLGRSPLGLYLFNCPAPDTGNMEILMKFGTPAQKERFLWPLVRGQVRSCFTMTEPEHAGSNPVWMSTTAVRDGDEYVINGHKWFATAADGAAFAIAMVVTNPDAPKPHHRASMVIVPTDTPGFTRVRNLPVMGEEGSDWLSHSEIRYEDCRVPVDNLLGEEGGGFTIAQERLGPGRIHHCMRWIGICERAFEMMCARLAQREIAPGEPLGSKQILQGYIGECRAEISAARLFVLDTAHKIDTVGASAARIEISSIKFFVANILHKVIDRAIQIYGGAGMLDDELLLAWWYRHERAARIYDGADEVHKAHVARRILRDYGVRVK